jgi:hypothetical protein
MAGEVLTWLGDAHPHSARVQLGARLGQAVLKAGKGLKFNITETFGFLLSVTDNFDRFKLGGCQCGKAVRVI